MITLIHFCLAQPPRNKLVDKCRTHNNSQFTGLYLAILATVQTKCYMHLQL